jgi:hypothetical protein
MFGRVLAPTAPMSVTLLNRVSGAVILALALTAAGCLYPRTGPSSARVVSPPRRMHQLTVGERRDILKRAQVWRPIDTRRLNLLAGPQGPGAFAFAREVVCTYDYPDKPLSGLTPKFNCAVAPKDVVKVKYGRDNGEIYAEVAATRLFWALGFAADRMYSVKVVCRACPEDPYREGRAEWHLGRSGRTSTVVFDPATIEREPAGEEVEVPGFEGWVWTELEEVDEESGGAPRAHVDALKLLAVFVQHVDTKPDQQAIVCAPAHLTRDRRGNATCTAPMLMVKDLGATFGGDRRLAFDKMHLASWREIPVWRNEPGCVGQLTRSFTGNLSNPRIGEAGRRFLAGRLALLSDPQIRDLFVAARVEERGETVADGGRRRPVNADDWVAVFKQKRAAIASRRCPA